MFFIEPVHGGLMVGPRGRAERAVKAIRHEGEEILIDVFTQNRGNLPRKHTDKTSFSL